METLPRPRAIGLAAALAVLGALTAACGDPGPAGAGPTVGRPATLGAGGERIDVTPRSAAPGRSISLSFRPDSFRGVAFSLDEWQAGAWVPRFQLTSDRARGSEPSWWSVEDSEGRGWDDVGVSGAGPDHVVVPAAATPGTYRICTANAPDQACGLLTVTGQPAQ